VGSRPAGVGFTWCSGAPSPGASRGTAPPLLLPLPLSPAGPAPTPALEHCSDGWSAQFVRFLPPHDSDSYGNVLSPATHGNVTNIFVSASEFSLTQADPWVSPATGRVYNTSSHIVVPALGLDLDVRTLIDDNEVAEWSLYEGASAVTGTHNGAAVTGTGFTEAFTALG
jgi:hypothetical protein